MQSIVTVFKTGFLLTVLLASHINLSAQQVFDRKATTVNNMGLSVTNVGTFGRPNVRSQPSGLPSMEYPRGSGTEHMFEAGIWIGAIRGGGATVVSTAAVTDPAGYAQGKAGFEFTNNGSVILERSSLPESPLFSPIAVSHQDLIAEFSDRRTAVGNVPIANHTEPLFAEVRKEVYSWNFGFTEAISIVKYSITNDADFDWDSVYVGMYADMVVRNVNTTIETGSNFFNKGGLGYLDSLYTLYVFDAGSTDEPSINTYGSMVMLGSEYRGMDFHPRDSSNVVINGYRTPKVGPSFWLFGTGTGDFTRPADDLDRYSKMASEFPLTDQNRESLRTDGQNANGNYIQLLSIGPFPKVEPGETFNVYFAFVTALKPDEFQNIGPGKRADSPESRVNLKTNVDWAFQLFDGQEIDGVRQRFLVPEPPAVPRLRVELGAGKATLFWDNRAEFSVDPVSGEIDFEGYRIYRSTIGDDVRGTISTNVQMIREYDVPDNDVGFNTGFDQIRLPGPVLFDDDPVEYQYSYEIDGLLNGWQYLFAVTAFDRGNIGVPSLETSVNANAIRVFPGTDVNLNFASSDNNFKVGVYPNPYRINAAWDGGTPFTRKLMFYNLPERAEIRVYTLAGEIVAELKHNSNTYVGDIRWFNDRSTAKRVMPGGEHAWDLLSDANQNITTGLYLYTVKDMNAGHVQQGKLVIIK